MTDRRSFSQVIQSLGKRTDVHLSDDNNNKLVAKFWNGIEVSAGSRVTVKRMEVNIYNNKTEIQSTPTTTLELGVIITPRLEIFYSSKFKVEHVRIDSIKNPPICSVLDALSTPKRRRISVTANVEKVENCKDICDTLTNIDNEDHTVIID
ncbi:uncharacterized protein LOC141904928 isoform X2 [Tubulanus polymorphus]|uniref:uncharacterized protein LOC141904928 isoform X2 n=1 Tax=Tubulanus polymorphus TaxID=672921 RepID=UPI003DA42D9D